MLKDMQKNAHIDLNKESGTVVKIVSRPSVTISVSLCYRRGNRTLTSGPETGDGIGTFKGYYNEGHELYPFFYLHDFAFMLLCFSLLIHTSSNQDPKDTAIFIHGSYVALQYRLN